MTVRELINKLQKFDENEHVRISVTGHTEIVNFTAGSNEIIDITHTADCDDVDKFQVDLCCSLGKVD